MPEVRFCKMWPPFLILIGLNLILTTNGQQDNANVPQLHQHQQNLNFEDDFLPSIPGYEVITEKPSESIGALDKCGEGEDRGKKICVPYYQCDGRTNTVVQDGKTDGFGIIDIRFGANSCEHYMEVCCKIPAEGPPPTVEPYPPTPRPPTPSPPTPTPVTPINDIPDACGIRHPNGIDFKITGNKHNEAEYGEFPWMVAILKKDFNPAVDPALAVCGGSLISYNVVLTGAHCVYKYKTFDLKIRAGEWDTQTDNERLPYQERGVKEIIIHDKFNPQTLYNDVALVVLEEPFQPAEHISTICLPNQGEVINSRQCFASGWGKNIFGREGEYQVILKKIELPIVPHDECQNSLRRTRLGKHFVLHESFLCAGGEAGKDTCTGDGGSPLVCPDPQNPTRYVQAGIVAWGIGCGETNIPGVYADVTKFQRWIENQFLNRVNPTDNQK